MLMYIWNYRLKHLEVSVSNLLKNNMFTEMIQEMHNHEGLLYIKLCDELGSASDEAQRYLSLIEHLNSMGSNGR